MTVECKVCKVRTRLTEEADGGDDDDDEEANSVETKKMCSTT